jgi:ribosome-associated heat shock protein Hsp15
MANKVDIDASADQFDDQRLDKWLWHGRVAKTRTLAATLVKEGKVRVNGERVVKPSHALKVGDGLTIAMRQQVRVLKVTGFAQKRGSATIAATLFQDLSPPLPPKSINGESDAQAASTASDARRERGSGRPTKRDRRDLERFKLRSEDG